jgi:hypothetical protein
VSVQIAGMRKAQAVALIAARAALPRSELTAVLGAIARSFTFASPLAVRHGLAILCRIPSAKLKTALRPLLGPLRAAYEANSAAGLMHSDPAAEGGREQVADPGAMALDDWLARVYLARLLSKLLFSGSVGGGQKQFLWQVLKRIAFSPRERPQVRLETWKALFGEVLPQPLALFPAGDPSHTAAPPPPFSDATEAQLAAFKATAWRQATGALMPKPAGKAGRRRGKAAPAASTDGDGAAAGGGEGADGPDRFTVMVSQLLKMLESPSAATVCGGARALRCVAEARAHAAHAAGDDFAEDPRITELMAVWRRTCQLAACSGLACRP